MMPLMPGRIALLLAIVLPIAAAEADTVYKYRRPDGRTIYSNKLEPGLELIETFEYKFADPVPARPGAAQSAVEDEARITKRLDDLQAAWTEVQDARRELALAEERLRAGSVEREGDRIGLIVFGAAAYPQVPLTLDHQSCRALLDQIDVGMAGPRTVLGDAIGLAIAGVMLALLTGRVFGNLRQPAKEEPAAPRSG